MLVMPSSSCSRRVVLAPTPGSRITSTSPGGIFASSFSRAVSFPVASSSSTFAAMVAPTSWSSVRRPSRASRSTDSPVCRNRAAALR